MPSFQIKITTGIFITIAFLVYGIAFSAPSGSNVLLSEIYYDTKAPSSGGSEDNRKEWVMLYNPTNAAIDISGWKLSETIPSVSPFTFPNESIINAKSFFLVVKESLQNETEI